MLPLRVVLVVEGWDLQLPIILLLLLRTLIQLEEAKIIIIIFLIRLHRVRRLDLHCFTYVIVLVQGRLYLMTLKIQRRSPRIQLPAILRLFRGGSAKQVVIRIRVLDRRVKAIGICWECH